MGASAPRKTILKRSQRAANGVVIVLLKDPGNGRFKHIVRNAGLSGVLQHIIYHYRRWQTLTTQVVSIGVQYIGIPNVYGKYTAIIRREVIISIMAQDHCITSESECLSIVKLLYVQYNIFVIL